MPQVTYLSNAWDAPYRGFERYHVMVPPEVTNEEVDTRIQYTKLILVARVGFPTGAHDRNMDMLDSSFMRFV